MDPDGFSLRIAYRFNDPDLLRRALTHRSHGSVNNERLEFLGDSVVNCVVALALYQKFPQLSEGELSRLRASLVNQQSLCIIAQECGLGEHLLLGEGELKSGGFRRPSILADAVEAVIGAVFLDGGFDGARAVVRRLFATSLDTIDPRNLGVGETRPFLGVEGAIVPRIDAVRYDNDGRMSGQSTQQLEVDFAHRNEVVEEPTRSPLEDIEANRFVQRLRSFAQARGGANAAPPDDGLDVVHDQNLDTAKRNASNPPGVLRILDL
jgi:hypothetical protein